MRKKIILALGLAILIAVSGFWINWFVKDALSSTKLEGFKGDLVKVAWSPDSKTLATAAKTDGSIRLWSPDGKLVDTITEPNWYIVYDFAWSPNSQLIAAATDNKALTIINVVNKTKINLSGHTDLIKSVCWSPNGEILASGGSYNDKTIRLWSQSGTPIATLKGHFDGIPGLAWSPDGKILASGSSYGKDGTTKLWTETGELITTLNTDQVNDANSLSWSPDSKTLALSVGENYLGLWSRENQSFDTISVPRIVNSLAWSPDGTKLVGGFVGGTIRLWDRQGKLLVENTRQKDVDQVAWSPDGKMFASASSDKTIVIWDSNGNFIQVLQGHSSNVVTISWSPDSTKLASGSWDRTARIWNIK